MTSPPLQSSQATLLVIDIQDAFTPVMPAYEDLLKRSAVMIQGAQALELPIIVTEQYPKGLGQTVLPLREILADDYRPCEKVTFNCLADDTIAQAVSALSRRQIIIVGIEAHICVAQTALALLAQNYDVIIPADAVTSRHCYDCDIAIQRLRHEGAVITTTEAALMEMTVSSKHPQFKTISKLIK